ncbi:MAG: O-antigen ligase family protein, partial [Proteobacteria bacterium]|nr:O-antigen ligase family protein [Pseudomonadota bacterium]
MKFSYRFYLCSLFFAPLAFGSSELWSIATVEVLACIAGILFFVHLYIQRKGLHYIPGLGPLVLLPVLLLLQLIPLPADFIRIISPSSYDAYAPILAISGGEWIPITINQKATLQEFFRISCYSLFYILTIQLLSGNNRLEKTLFWVIGLAATIALLAIIQQVSSPDKIYWFRAVPENAAPFGPWVNPNQFAGFMEMMSPLALGLFLFYKPRVSFDQTIRERIVNFFSMPGSHLYLFLGFAATLMAMSVFVSLCRGGILTMILSAFVFLLLYSMKKTQRGRTAIFIVIGCVVLAVSWFGWDSIFREFERGINQSGELTDGRFFLWSDSLRIIQSFFFMGSGFGTFVDIFPSFRSFPGEAIFEHAHNDYLELLTDGGLVGFTLTGWFVFAVLSHGWKMIRLRRHQFPVLLGIGAFTGIIAMLMHSVTDFNMHNGADGLYFFFLCGLLVAVVNTRFDNYGSATLLKRYSTKLNLYIFAGIVILTLGTLIVQYGAVRAKSEYNNIKDLYISHHLTPIRLEEVINGASNASQLDPLEYQYNFKLGTVEWSQNNRDESLKYFLRASRQKPMDGTSLQRVALLLDDERTTMLLEQGYQRGLDNDDLALTYAEYLLWKDDREKAVEIIAERSERSPGLLREWAPLLESFSFSREEIARTLPSSVNTWISYGSYL